MNQVHNKIAISSVVFTSTDPEVLVKGTVSRGNLAYETELLISQTQLNMVLNQLRKQNDSFSVEDHLKTEYVAPNEQLFYADLSTVTYPVIDVYSIEESRQITQIRA